MYRIVTLPFQKKIKKWYLSKYLPTYLCKYLPGEQRLNIFQFCFCRSFLKRLSSKTLSHPKRNHGLLQSIVSSIVVAQRHLPKEALVTFGEFAGISPLVIGATESRIPLPRSSNEIVRLAGPSSFP
jgi:hypothetical protein